MSEHVTTNGKRYELPTWSAYPTKHELFLRGHFGVAVYDGEYTLQTGETIRLVRRVKQEEKK